MEPINAIIASLDFVHAPNATTGVRQFIWDRSVVLSYLQDHWADFVAWLSQPPVFACVITWAIVFTTVIVLLLGLGFGPVGIVAGSTMAAFQAWMYGGFTPAAGIFATLTSLGMVGLFMPAVVAVAAVLATVAACIVWACGVGT